MENQEFWLTAKEIAEAIKMSEKNFIKKASYRKGVYENIQSRYETTPNGRIIKYLASSLPTQWQEQIQGLLQIAHTQTGNALNIASQFGEKAIIAVSTIATAQVLELSAKELVPILENLGYNSTDLDELVAQKGCSVDTAIRTARQREVVNWWRKHAQTLPANQVDAFKYNTWEALKSLKEEIGTIGKPFFSLKSIELPMPKMIGNASASKFEKGVEAWIIAHYATGNKPSVARLFNLYNEVRMEYGWRPITEMTLRNWVKEIGKTVDFGREGEKQFKMEYGLAQLRELPQNVGDVVSFDGTPANFWVLRDGKARQCAYKMVAVDVASRFVVTVVTQGENTLAYIELFKAWVRSTRRLPKIVETDYFQGYKEFAKYLEEWGVKHRQPAKGNARAKYAEGVIGKIATQTEKYLENFSGLNMISAEGRLSDEWREQATKHAISWQEAIEQVAIATTGYNNVPVRELEGQPCGKFPVELFLEKCKLDDEVSKEMFVRIVGELRTVTLTMSGLVVHKNRTEYAFMPDFEAWGAESIARWFNANLGKKFDLYVQDFDLPVLVHDHQTTKQVGWFTPRERTQYAMEYMTEQGKNALFQTRTIVKQQIQQAKQAIAQASAEFPNAFEAMRGAVNIGQDLLVLDDGEVVNMTTGETESTLKGSTGKEDLNSAEEAMKMPVGETKKPATSKKGKNKPEDLRGVPDVILGIYR